MSRYLMDDGFVYDANDQGPSNRPFAMGRRLFKGGGGGGTQTTKVELPDYAQDYARELMQRSESLSNQPIPQYTGQISAPLTGDQFMAMELTRNRALNGSADINAARGNLAATMQGQYFRPTEVNPYGGATNPYSGPNPYIDQAIQKTQGDIARSYAAGTGAQTLAQFRNAGAFGGSAMQETQDMQNRALGDTLANASSQMRMQDYGMQQQLAAQDLARNAQIAESGLARGDQNYNAERQRQLQGMMFAPQLAETDYRNYQALLGIGDIQREADQNRLNDLYTQWQNNVNAPLQQLEILANGIQGATGGGMARNVTSPNPYQPNRTAGALGGALSGAAAGSMFGPWGAAIGGGLGLLGGLF
ncbi:conserved hypothetical protein [Cupriavidus taiwanensis]|uniref:hypothetical protein n=1 Tax=Cupriavidus taiwanensis TaxID=164546 RepID=UPI000E1442BF|nr:hypothetical protein [Cupriavidus taiwanensis]SOY79927.1 conserved hypothetical protein [Cupriavidus taiwanensis]SOY81896.1 conserved hypothetical protein [Cupriavidus taiwanensis]